MDDISGRSKGFCRRLSLAVAGCDGLDYIPIAQPFEAAERPLRRLKMRETLSSVIRG